MRRTYVLGVPGLVAGWSLGQKDDVGQEDAEQQHRAHYPPCHLPVETRPPPSHPLNVITEPAEDTGNTLAQVPLCGPIGQSHPLKPRAMGTPSPPWILRYQGRAFPRIQVAVGTAASPIPFPKLP